MASLLCCFDSVLAVGAADGRRGGRVELGVHVVLPPSMGVCVFVVLSSLSSGQTDSWSNRLKGAVGSLGGDLSPLGSLFSGQQLKVQHRSTCCFVFTQHDAYTQVLS